MPTEMKNGHPCVHAKSRKHWRTWLEKNHQTAKAVWLILYRKHSTTPSVIYAEAVEEAMCFGWIDGRADPRDGESSYLYFTARKPKSNWSKLNRERVERLMAEGRMTESGQKMVDLAKATGTWEALLDVENNVIPEDLQKQFDANPMAFQNFMAFTPSAKTLILTWILSAKRPETRQKRIEETVRQSALNKKAFPPT